MDSHSKFDPASSLSLVDLQDMVNQVHLPSFSASNTALSMISGTSPTWLLDSACSNHMTSSPDVVPSHTSTYLGRLFELIFLHLPSSRLSPSTVLGHSTSSLTLWHSRLGHASISRVKQLVSRGLLGSISNKSFDCMPCQFGKQTALPFNNSVSHALSSFDLIHSDVWGPSPISTPGGSRYFVIFVDDFSRYTWIYLFKNRSELYQIYCDFTKMIERQFS